MKKITNITLLIITSFLLSSCSSYIARVHRGLDRDLNQQTLAQQKDQFAQFRQQPQEQVAAQRPARPNISPLISSGHVPNMAPAVKRQYRQGEETNRRRTTANDLNDNDNSGSLWVTNGTSEGLFGSNRQHNYGDIILINVYKKLRNEITLELKRAFPTPVGARTTASATDTPQEAGLLNVGEEATDDERVYDRISTVIVEQINRDHILLRGRKNVLFQNRKRLVEVQALVPRRDITDADSINSDSILESSINVLR